MTRELDDIYCMQCLGTLPRRTDWKGYHMKTIKETIETTWEVWTYDVWGNAHDGYEVNDRYCHCREHPITLKVTRNNAGLSSEFLSAYPTDKQIRKALDIKPRVQLDLDGDDMTIYVRHASTGYPLGELTCTSHVSLSPIKAYPDPDQKAAQCASNHGGDCDCSLGQ